jgi:hypothetical protein
MKYPHSVPLWRTNEELLAGQFFSQVVLSVGTGWNEVVLEQHRLPSSELADLTYRRHVVVINLGHSSTWEFEKDGVSAGPKGKRRDFLLSKPSAFSGRLKVERGVFTNILFLALNPVLVSRVAEDLELDSDRIEMIQQRRSTDPTLHHIAKALRAGVQSGWNCNETHLLGILLDFGFGAENRYKESITNGERAPISSGTRSIRNRCIEKLG